ncbi:MAG: hypothetical protein PUA96_07825 [Bacteroidales bacterium]|nr:hypothetical protein [Bacteroidales bacterium]
MTKVYVMATCPDCFEVKARLSGNPDFEIIDIGEHVRNLKEFIRLRDSSPAFDSVRANGSIGIPCFVSEDGRICFDTEAFIPKELPSGAACSLDGKGC